jgi:hypothetical protein
MPGHSVLELSPVVAAAKLQDPDCEGVTKKMRLHNAVAADGDDFSHWSQSVLIPINRTRGGTP